MLQTKSIYDAIGDKRRNWGCEPESRSRVG